MGRSKKPVETIKVIGLNQQSVQEFSPKADSTDEDYLWEQYFKGSPTLIKFPASHTKTNVEGEEERSEELDISAPTLLDPSNANLNRESRTKSESGFTYLDATHTASEAKIYSVIYRETVLKNNEPQHFGALRIMKLTGIGSDKTVRKAIKSLIEKKSILLIDPCPHNPLGPAYQAVAPKEVISDRKRSGININLQTKKIVEKTAITGVITPVPTGVSSPVKITGVTPVETTPVTPVKITGVTPSTHYIKDLNYLNTDEFKNSSSNVFKYIEKKEKTDDDLDIKKFAKNSYEKYSEIPWTSDDDTLYDSQNLRRYLPDVIEAGIIKGVLRAKSPVTSLDHLIGTIEEAEVSLPPGMLNYLRRRWQGSRAEPQGERGELILPQDSIFDPIWLNKFISQFQPGERAELIRKAEVFDSYMLGDGRAQEWIKNPTGYFVKFARGELNLKLDINALSFNERVVRESERQRAADAEQGRERVEEQVRALIEGLSEDERGRLTRNARGVYNIPAAEGEGDSLERVLYKLVIEWERGGDWREVWERLTSEGE
ncbi:MAG: hypothetical protein ACT4NX_10645 [Deltaproteobacteria bacterium]